VKNEPEEEQLWQKGKEIPGHDIEPCLEHSKGIRSLGLLQPTKGLSGGWQGSHQAGPRTSLMRALAFLSYRTVLGNFPPF
jgi:hypothetical protein